MLSNSEITVKNFYNETVLLVNHFHPRYLPRVWWSLYHQYIQALLTFSQLKPSSWGSSKPKLSNFSSGTIPSSHASPQDTSILHNPKSLLKTKRKREQKENLPNTALKQPPAHAFSHLLKKRSLPAYNSKPRENDQVFATDFRVAYCYQNA